MLNPNRKRLLIHPRFQLRMLLYTLTVSIAVVSFYGLAVYTFVNRLNGFVAENGTDTVKAFLEVQQRSLFAGFFFVSFMTLGFICALTMVLSHRIAGPLYRMNGFFNEIAEGKKKTELSFRDSDYFPELADSCNKALRSLGLGDSNKQS